MSGFRPANVPGFTIVVVVALLISACSSNRLAYRFADRGVVWWVEDYVSLTGEQKSDLRRDLRELRSWHCESELPRYGSWLGELRAEIRAGDLSRERIHYHQSQAVDFVPPVTQRLLPAITHLLASLSDEQVAELTDNLRTSQRELEQEYLEDDTPEAARERVEERAERWLGSLNEDQKRIISQWRQGRDTQTRIWLQGRAQWQATFTDLLTQRHWPRFPDRLEDLIINHDDYRGEAYRSMVQQNTPQLVRLVHDLLRHADDQHWQHLEEETGKLHRDVAALSCSSDSLSAGL